MATICRPWRYFQWRHFSCHWKYLQWQHFSRHGKVHFSQLLLSLKVKFFVVHLTLCGRLLNSIFFLSSLPPSLLPSFPLSLLLYLVDVVVASPAATAVTSLASVAIPNSMRKALREGFAYGRQSSLLATAASTVLGGDDSSLVERFKGHIWIFQ